MIDLHVLSKIWNLQYKKSSIGVASVDGDSMKNRHPQTIDNSRTIIRLIKK